MTLFIVNSVIIVAFLVFLVLKGKSSKATSWVASIKARLLQMMAASKDMRRFSGFTSAPIAYIRNPSLWVRGFDFSGTAAGINGLGGVGGGTLITPRHVLLANHVPYRESGVPFPLEMFFVNNAGQTLVYKVIDIQQVGKSDIAIGTLDRNADPSLTIYPILPDNWLRYIVNQTETRSAMGSVFQQTTVMLPVLYLDYEKKIFTGDLTEIRMSLATVMTPTFEAARAYAESLVIGDSGNPIFVMVGDKLALLGAWFRGTEGEKIGAFPWLADYRSQVEEITGIRLRTIDLSGFQKVA